MKIGNLCVTKYNMGDSTETTIPSAAGVTVAKKSGTCSSEKCCWSSGSSYDPTDNSYYGSNRTVCNWGGGNATCANYKKGGRIWRLPTPSELSNWRTYSSDLMLCDGGGSHLVSCGRSYNCPGADGGICYPYYVWSGSTNGSRNAYRYAMNNASWNGDSGYRTDAFSIRCVTEM